MRLSTSFLASSPFIRKSVSVRNATHKIGCYSLCYAFILVLTNVCSAQVAVPGSYGPPTYSGGLATAGNNSFSWPYAFYVQNQEYGTRGIFPGSNFYPPIAAITDYTYCRGQIKTQFTWNGGNSNIPPPSTVLVAQKSWVSWQEPYYYTGSPGSCNNGFNDPVLPIGTIGATCSGTHYTFMTPDSNGDIEVYCTPSVSMPAVGNGFSSYSGVVYTASVSPVTINFTTGTTLVNGAQEALTGQQIGATLSIAGTVTSTTWSTSGATGPNPIKNWDPNAPGDGNATQIIPLTSSDYTPTNVAAPFNFYDSNPDTVTVKCTGTVTFPDGTSSSFSAVSPTVTFMKPTVTLWNVNTPLAYTTISGFSAGLPYGPFSAQEVWDSMTVTLPSPFNQGSQGQACMAQIINADRAWYRNPVDNGKSSAYKSLQVVGAKGATSFVINPTALDSAFPYPFGYNGTTGQGVKTGYIWQVGNLGYSGDQPKQPYTLNVDDGGGNHWYNSVANDSFTSWMMYQPPGNNSIWVPLQSLTWNWGGVAILMQGIRWGVRQTPLFFSSSATDTMTYPSWTQTLPVGFGIQP